MRLLPVAVEADLIDAIRADGGPEPALFPMDVTKAGEEMKSERRFLRTTLGSYARKYQLTVKESPEFQGD